MDNKTFQIRERILYESFELFKKHAINFVTMDMIARELGMSKKTLYVHFKNKEEILYEGFKIRISERKQKQDEILHNSSNVIDGMMALMLYHSKELAQTNPILFEEVQRYYPKVFKLLEENRNIDNYNFTLHLLEKGKKEGLFLESLDIDIITKLFLAQLYLIINHELFPVSDYPKDKLFKHIFIHFLRGISTQKGQTIITEIMDKEGDLHHLNQ